MVEVYQTLLYDVYGSASSASEIVAAAKQQFDCHAAGTCTFNVLQTSTRRKLQGSLVRFSMSRRVEQGVSLLPPALNETLLSLEAGQGDLAVVGSIESTQADITTTNSGGFREAGIVTSGILSSESLAIATSAALSIEASRVTAATPTSVYPPSPPPRSPPPRSPPPRLPVSSPVPPPGSTQSYNLVSWIAAAVALASSACVLLFALFMCAFVDPADERWWSNTSVIPNKRGGPLPPLKRGGGRAALERFTFSSLRTSKTASRL